jgi:uncharacterized protein (DUF4415 family)
MSRERFIERGKQAPLTAEQIARLDRLAAMPDETIDFSDAPPMSEQQMATAVRGEFYRPVKRSITARLDADVLDWLQADGKGYQSRMNAILRREMLAALSKAAE